MAGEQPKRERLATDKGFVLARMNGDCGPITLLKSEK